MKTAFLFPGQGAQFPGMGKDLFEASPRVREYFAMAGEALGKNMETLLFEASEETLKITENTQAAVTLVNISAAQVLAEQGITPDICAGFSVGEYASLYVAGIVGLPDLFKLVAIRGEVMERESRLHDAAEGPAAMSAVLGLTIEVARPIMESLASNKVFIANHSSPTQIVIAGTAKGLGLAEEALKAAGAMKVVRLNVSGPFHSPLLAGAAQEFHSRIAAIPFNAPRMPMISNVTAKPITSGEEARELARQQIMGTVRWVETMEFINDQGSERILEVGPGKVLSGLWRSFSKEKKCQLAGTKQDIDLLKS